MENLNELYLGKRKIKALYKIISKHPDWIFLKAIKIHKRYRKYKKNNKKIRAFLYGIKANRLASKYNLELYGEIGENIRIWHGNTIINGNAKLGNNVQLHGNNCIGEKSNGDAPMIGNNVEIGYGTSIIGNIKIANNVIIGANSLVNKSFYEEGVVIAGCPARVIKKI